MKKLLRSIGPAIIVAAVVLGPGSILTSSKVGATYGYPAVLAVIGATILMISMVALSARVGVIHEKTPCGELAGRLGRPVAVFIGVILFTLVAFFQSSNNVAVVGGLEPLFGLGGDGSYVMGTGMRIGLVIVVNAIVIAALYLSRNLYGTVERFMKILIGIMVIAFVINFAVITFAPRGYEPVENEATPDLFALLGMIGTTFSVGGAFYQAYLVRERGWGLADARKGLFDSVVSISVLGLVTAIILMTATRVFHGNPNPVVLDSVGKVAMQLKPTFGPMATVIFACGILAGAFSSILVNAMIGGTVLSDSLGKGSKLSEKWPIHLTTVALIVGALVAIAAFLKENSTVHLITLAQACTVIGLPVLAAALIYLGTRKELTGERKVPRWILTMAIIGFIVACGLAYRLSTIVHGRLFPEAG
ncbi:MAG: hypothetical protein HKN23_02295 [Verrucomicrobiales bacterium]|nr:hypothetical protein [Verrucomicrobiales bacterium]